jgi:hypothetical protein
VLQLRLLMTVQQLQWRQHRQHRQQQQQQLMCQWLTLAQPNAVTQQQLMLLHTLMQM